MTIGLMQPYFLPYLGYWQLVDAVDEFIIHDDVEYSKGGWYNRNNILLNNQKHLFTLPLAKASDSEKINKREFANSITKEKEKVIRKIQNAYVKSPHFKKTFEILEEIFQKDTQSLVTFNVHAIQSICRTLQISTPVSLSSELKIGDNITGPDRVLAVCKQKQAKKYINPIGGKSLYSAEIFASHGVSLKFIEMLDIRYFQNSTNFIPSLSIIDALFHVGIEETKSLLTQYRLIP